MIPTVTFECLVHSVDRECVTCEMHDITDESMPVEIAEIWCGKIPANTLAVLRRNQIFYWSVFPDGSSTFRVRRQRAVA